MTDSPTSVALSESTLRMRNRRCPGCYRAVAYYRTDEGTHMAFDPEPLDIAFDDGSGWAPGSTLVNGRVRIVLIPLARLEAGKRARVSIVMTAHHCASAA